MRKEEQIIINRKNYIKGGMCGKHKYYTDDDLIRENSQFGRVVREEGSFD